MAIIKNENVYKKCLVVDLLIEKKCVTLRRLCVPVSTDAENLAAATAVEIGPTGDLKYN